MIIYNNINIISKIVLCAILLLFTFGCCIPIPYIYVIDLNPKVEFIEIHNKLNEDIKLCLSIPELSYLSTIDVSKRSIKKWDTSILEHSKNIFCYDFEIKRNYYNSTKFIRRRKEDYKLKIMPKSIYYFTYPFKYKKYFYRIIITKNDIIFDVR